MRLADQQAADAAREASREVRSYSEREKKPTLPRLVICLGPFANVP
jgi:hypothetical protein